MALHAAGLRSVVKQLVAIVQGVRREKPRQVPVSGPVRVSKASQVQGVKTVPAPLRVEVPAASAIPSVPLEPEKVSAN